MPPMQISRVLNQNGDSPEENGGVDSIENGLDDFENLKVPPMSDSVGLWSLHSISVCFNTYFQYCRTLFSIC